MVAQNREHLADGAAAIARDEFAAARQPSARIQRIAFVLAGSSARIRGGKVEGCLAVVPCASARIAFDICGAGIAGVDRQSIRDACAIVDAARSPLAARALEHVRLRMIGDNETAAVAEIDVMLRRPALPMA